MIDQKKLLLLQCELALAQAAIKEYKAEWMPGQTVMRDAFGRFATKGSAIAQESKQIIDSSSKGLQTTKEMVEEYLQDPKFRKRVNLTAGSFFAKSLKQVEQAVLKNPEIEISIDKLINKINSQIEAEYGKGNSALAQAIRESDPEPPSDATFGEKMEFYVKRYKAFKESLKTPKKKEPEIVFNNIQDRFNHFINETETGQYLLAKIKKYAAPIIIGAVATILPEIIIGLDVGGLASIAEVFGAGIWESIGESVFEAVMEQFGANWNIDGWLEDHHINSEAFRIVSAAFFGLLTGTGLVFKKSFANPEFARKTGKFDRKYGISEKATAVIKKGINVFKKTSPTIEPVEKPVITGVEKLISEFSIWAKKLEVSESDFSQKYFGDRILDRFKDSVRHSDKTVEELAEATYRLQNKIVTDILERKVSRNSFVGMMVEKMGTGEITKSKIAEMKDDFLKQADRARFGKFYQHLFDEGFSDFDTYFNDMVESIFSYPSKEVISLSYPNALPTNVVNKMFSNLDELTSKGYEIVVDNEKNFISIKDVEEKTRSLLKEDVHNWFEKALIEHVHKL